MSPDGEVLVAGTVAGEIRVWALPKAPVKVPSTAGAGPEAGAPNAGSSAGGESGVPAPLPDPVVVPSLPGHASPVRHMRFSRDAQRLARGVRRRLDAGVVPAMSADTGRLRPVAG